MRVGSFHKSRKRLTILLLFFIVSTNIYGASFSVGSTSSSSQISVILNNVKLSFDVNPYIKDGRTLVPFRKIFESFGMEVQWNAEQRTVLAKNTSTEISLKINDKNAYVNKEKNILDVPPEIVNSRTFVPLRFIGESIGADVQWNGKTKTVSITYTEGNTTTSTNTPVVTSAVTPTIAPSAIPPSSPVNTVGKYKLGDTVQYEDFSFSVDNVALNTEEGSVAVRGKISAEGKNLLFYMYSPSGSYVFANPIIIDKEGDKYNYVAYAFTPSGTNYDKVSSIQIKILKENKTSYRVAEFVLD